ncbi:hypothetical protein NLI96_g10401 [Meripilus lineatus]|uniref:DNA replication licensing factor MCM4 n=1 Tax=Meripilus lineatus TaxID=2056292 RepID=A0AAD5YED9_9APHY|nr:hypothetical protein NLI96_g10401 [Physisporinus lineatus]
MSSPLNFPSSDIPDAEMEDATEATHNAPAAANSPLFLPSTPSAVGTPRPHDLSSDPATPSALANVMARRAIGLSTPRRPQQQLFARGSSPSSPLAFPSSSPTKSNATPRRVRALGSDAPGSTPSSEPLDFPTTPSATPRNRRGDIHPTLRYTPSHRPRPRRANGDGSLPPSSAPNFSAPTEPDEEPDEIRAIWGTTVNLADTMKAFREFLRGFKVKYRVAYDRERGVSTRILRTPEEGEVVLYETYLRRMRQTGDTSLNLDMMNMAAYPPSRKLQLHLAKYPQEVVPALDQVLKDLMLEIASEDQDAGLPGMEGAQGELEIADIMAKAYTIRPFGIPPINLRDLNPTDTDKLVCIKGLVIRATPVIPDMKTAFFRCLTCNHTTQGEIDRGKIEEPARCPREVCGSVGTMSLIHNRCIFADRQVIRLQETPDAVPDGQTPHTVSLSVYDDLVDVSKPGDRLVVTGVFRSVPVRVNPRQRTIKSLFKTFLDVVHVRLGQDNRMGFDKSTRPAGADRVPGVGGFEDFEDEEDQADRERMMSKKEEMERKLKELSQRDDIYELLARSLAPSIWALEDVKKGILLQLFGGTNKSIARGGGAGGPRYRGDINVLLVGDPGVSKSQILQEQQTVSIAKAGIITTLNARTSILAAANPIGSKYNRSQTVTKNIDLPPTLISRFDLLYLVLDQVDEALDRQLAQHLVNLYLEDAPDLGSQQEILPIEELSAYITYARSRINPTITEAAGQELVQSYVTLRKAGEDPRSSERRITATTRQLESMIRLSEAHARMRFSPLVELQDVKESFRLMREAINTGARDPTTGEIDMGLLDTGIGRAQRRMRMDMRREVGKMLDEMGERAGNVGVRWSDAYKKLEGQSSVKVTTAEFHEMIKELEQEGVVKVVGERDKRMIRKVA